MKTSEAIENARAHPSDVIFNTPGQIGADGALVHCTSAQMAAAIGASSPQSAALAMQRLGWTTGAWKRAEGSKSILAVWHPPQPAAPEPVAA